MMVYCYRSVSAGGMTQTHVLFQLCYSHVFKGDEGNFTCLHNHKSKVGVDFGVPLLWNVKTHSHLVYYC